MADGRIAIRKHRKDAYCKTLDDASAAAGVLRWMPQKVALAARILAADGHGNGVAVGTTCR